ncbi:hypothetical protein PAL_GLEAN10013420 [Pteropus alecto]|uniref:Uncharacterized protein n=1 Tax=Pteropus alecto TaxID=9402 RepID=L5JPD9_PTEAL|nr:hypothetical protein PAL_GLEAN10013420 [Pteropus alecto]
MAAFDLPSFSQERPSCSQKRDKDIATPRSGNLHEAASTPGPPGGDFTLSGAGNAAGRERPGSDLQQLLQSGQEEGGTLESRAPGVLLLLPPRLHRRLSDSSSCRSRRGVSRTRAENSGRSQLSRSFRSPQGGRLVCSAGERCSPGPLQDGCGPPKGRWQGVGVLTGVGGGPESGPAAEIARPAFCPGTSCRTSLGWNLERGVRRSAGKCTPEDGRLRRVPHARHPLQAGLVVRSPRISDSTRVGPRLGGARDLGDPPSPPMSPRLTPPLSSPSLSFHSLHVLEQLHFKHPRQGFVPVKRMAFSD